ncbi:DgyrCDS14936, partial [Dimorphilus gyrociliatus]
MDFTEIPYPTDIKLRIANREWAKYHGQEVNTNEPYPSPLTKEEVLKNYSFEELDKIALETITPMIMKNSLPQLVQHLMGVCKDDMEKLRIIFRWVTSPKLKEINTDNSSPETVGYEIKNLFETHNIISLFARLCRLANISCHIVTGVDKYLENDGTNKTDSLQMIECKWSIVKVSNKWYICHPLYAWCHGYLKLDGWTLLNSTCESKCSQNEIIYKYTETYFMSNPEQFIFRFFPDNPKNQLLARPLTMQEFRDAAKMNVAFFNIGLSILSHPRHAIETNKANNEIIFGINENFDGDLSLQLFILSETVNNDKNQKMTMKDSPEKTHYITFIDKNRARCVIWLRLPFPSQYQFIIQQKETILCMYSINYKIPPGANVQKEKLIFPKVASYNMGENDETRKLNFYNFNPQT